MLVVNNPLIRGEVALGKVPLRFSHRILSLFMASSSQGLSEEVMKETSVTMQIDTGSEVRELSQQPMQARGVYDRVVNNMVEKQFEVSSNFDAAALREFLPQEFFSDYETVLILFRFGAANCHGQWRRGSEEFQAFEFQQSSIEFCDKIQSMFQVQSMRNCFVISLSTSDVSIPLSKTSTLNRNISLRSKIENPDVLRELLPTACLYGTDITTIVSRDSVYTGPSDVDKDTWNSWLFNIPNALIYIYIHDPP